MKAKVNPSATFAPFFLSLVFYYQVTSVLARVATAGTSKAPGALLNAFFASIDFIFKF